jgi:spore coat polysaccharide biosynthesis predicted glycosyltransferase SpsG
VIVRWGLRVATDRRFGAGHIARCRSLAAVLDKNVVLYCDPDTGDEDLNWAAQVVREKATDSAAAATSGLRDRTIQALVVDTYAVGDEAISEAAKAWFVAVFRDASPYGPETVSVNPNPGFGHSETVISGPAFMPLSAEIVRLNEVARRAAKPRTHGFDILVGFGARDEANRTMVTLEALAAHSERVNVSIAIGHNAVHAAAVSRRASELNCDILRERHDLASVYSRFDLAIGAPGVSQFERACCGLPSILVPQTERQEPLTRAWAETGAASNSEPISESISRTIAALLDEPSRIFKMRERGMETVDGKGAIRLADALNSMVASR